MCLEGNALVILVHTYMTGGLCSVQLYTVNPIAVNSRFANVFTENKRSVLILDSPVSRDVWCARMEA